MHRYGDWLDCDRGDRHEIALHVEPHVGNEVQGNHRVGGEQQRVAAGRGAGGLNQ